VGFALSLKALIALYKAVILVLGRRAGFVATMVFVTSWRWLCLAESVTGLRFAPLTMLAAALLAHVEWHFPLADHERDRRAAGARRRER
jgi:hypothetical protein